MPEPAPKPFWQSRTFWLNLATLVVTLGTTLLGLDWIRENPEAAALIGALIAAANLVLRFLTAEPVRLLALVLAAGLAAAGAGCSAKAEARIQGPAQIAAGELAIFSAADSAADSTAWLILPDSRQLIEFDGGRRAGLAIGQPGTYTLVLAVALDSDVDVARHTFTVGPVGPTPPGPNPPGPTPPGPAPIPTAGLRVLIVEETADRPKLPAGQAAIFTSAALRDWLDANCAKTPDGKAPDWRILDKDADLALDLPHWRQAMALPRSTLPWLIVSDGSRGYSGPLPATEAETLALLDAYRPR
jgi:hypothetical protein